MRLLGLLLFTSLIFPLPDDFQGKVVSIADGDTVTVLRGREQAKVRLNGIDAPEKNQSFGTKSKDALAALAFGKTVTIHSSGTDRYGRTLGVIVSDGVNVNEQLVANGWAWHYKQYSTDAKLAQHETSAKAGGKGLWADPNPLPPWAARPVECIPKEPNPNLIAQTACNQEGQLVERLCTQGLPRTPKRSCITECLVQKEDYAVAMTKCCASQPCVGNKLLPLQPLCLKALDCFTFQPLGPCLETCLQRPPAYHPDDPVDRDHEIIKRIRTLAKNAQKNCVGLPHPCDVCK